MARSQIPVSSITRSGLTQPAQTTADASNKHYFTNDGRTLVEVISTDVGAQTVAFEIPTNATVDNQAVTSLSLTVAAGATRYVGPFPTTIYSQADGTVYVDPSVSTTLKFRAYKI